MGRSEVVSEIYVDRLSLKLSGLTDDEGSRLALLVAKGLGSHSVGLVSGGPVNATDVRSGGTKDLDLLSTRIIAEVMRELNRSI